MRRFHGDAVLWLGDTPSLLDTAARCLVPKRYYASAHCASWPAPDGPASTEAAGFCTLAADPGQLPFASRSLDGAVLHHVLEATADQRTALREAVRVLRPGGRLVVVGVNPASLWQLARPRAAFRHLHPVAVLRLYEWLAVLGMEREAETIYLNYRSLLPLALHSERWQRASEWLRAQRLPVGGSYLIAATKVGQRLVGQHSAARERVPQATPLPTPATRTTAQAKIAAQTEAAAP